MGMLNAVSRLRGVAENKIGQLSTIAKGILCLPSIIAGISLPNLGKLAGGLIGGISAAIEDSVNAMTQLVLQSIQEQVDAITGSINGLLSTVVGLVATIAGTIEHAKQFVQSIRDQIADIKDFVSTKENCQFAAATLANCIVGQTVNNLSISAIKDISNGLASIGDVTKKITNTINGPTGAINNFMREGSRQINKASRVIEASKLL